MGHTYTKKRKVESKRSGKPRAIRKGYSTVPRSRGVYARGEMKYFDTALAGTSLTATTTTWPAGTVVDPTTFNTLVVPQVGAAINQRIGREVKIMKIQIRGHLSTPAQATVNTADAGAPIRMILVQDMQTNSAQMTAAQLLSDNSTSETTINSFQNLNNFGRFKVLKDKRIDLYNPNLAGEVAAANVIQNGLVKSFKITHKFRKPVSIRFNATNGGTVADIVDNSFHLICAAQNIALAPAITYVCRVGFKE